METNADLDSLKRKMSYKFDLHFERAAADIARSKAFQEATGIIDITPQNFNFDQNSFEYIKRLFNSQLLCLSIIVAVSPVVNEFITRKIILEAMRSIGTDTIEWFKNIFNLHTDDIDQIYNAICVVITGTLSAMCISAILAKVTGSKLDRLLIIYGAIELGNSDIELGDSDVVDIHFDDMRRYFENISARIGQFFLKFVAISIRKEVANLNSLKLKISDELCMQFPIVASNIGTSEAFQRAAGAIDATPKHFDQNSFEYIIRLFDSQLLRLSMIEFVTSTHVDGGTFLDEYKRVKAKTFTWVVTTFHLYAGNFKGVCDVVRLLMTATLSKVCLNALLANLGEENELDRLQTIQRAIYLCNFKVIDRYVADIRTYFEIADAEVGLLFFRFVTIVVTNRINAILNLLEPRTLRVSRVSDEIYVQFQIVASHIGTSANFQRITRITDLTTIRFGQDSLVHIRRLLDSRLLFLSMRIFVTSPYGIDGKAALREMDLVERDTINWVATTFHLRTNNMKEIYKVVYVLMTDTLSKLFLDALLANLGEENELDRLQTIHRATGSCNLEVLDRYIGDIRTYFEIADAGIGLFFIDFIHIVVNNRINAILENNLHEQEQVQDLHEPPRRSRDVSM
jgi:hypothetical protein